MIEHKRIKGLSFDDILIPPVYSDIRSRSEPDTSTRVGPLELKIPFISSPMDTVTESKMAIELGKLGGLGVIHRFMDPQRQVEECQKVAQENQWVVPAIGVGESERKRLTVLMNSASPIHMVSIDVANGHSILMKEMVDWVKANYPGLPIMAGNIATFHGYEFMIELGVDAVRVGVGGGCLMPTTTVLTKRGDIPISEIELGDVVLTHSGEWNSVTDIITSLKNEEVISINGIETTTDHKYYVVNVQDLDKLTDENIHNFAFWLPAGEINDNHMLVGHGDE
jgi:IMP dehydrogenase